MPKPYELTAREAAEKIKSQELTAEDYVSSLLERIRTIDNQIHAYVRVIEEESLKAA